jgi:DNA-binding SARP family transcriptional activator
MAAMSFGVLGPLLVRDGGKTVRVPAARQRAVLAAMLVRRGQVVSLDKLTETLWDGPPPRDARATVQTYIMRLRRVLGPTLASKIVTRPPGYMIQVAENEFDQPQFAVLCRAGEAAAREGEWERASRLMRSALDLWRGPALADVSSYLLQSVEAPWFEELRLRALELRIEADLNLCRHDEAIAELQRLTAEHPYRERFRIQLMLALWRAARRADALSVYQQMRQTFVDDLGIEPGQEAQDLHQRILACDAVTTWPSLAEAEARAYLAAEAAASAQVPYLGRSRRVIGRNRLAKGAVKRPVSAVDQAAVPAVMEAGAPSKRRKTVAVGRDRWKKRREDDAPCIAAELDQLRVTLDAMAGLVQRHEKEIRRLTACPPTEIAACGDAGPSSLVQEQLVKPLLASSG